MEVKSIRGLTPRQKEILQMLADGQTVNDVADKFKCTTATIYQHIRHTFWRLGVRDNDLKKAIDIATQRGIIGGDDAT